MEIDSQGRVNLSIKRLQMPDDGSPIERGGGGRPRGGDRGGDRGRRDRH
jgi:hypothetical protein